jgi:hypothetical protein
MQFLKAKPKISQWAIWFAIALFSVFSCIQAVHFHPDELNQSTEHACALCATAHNASTNIVPIGLAIVLLPTERLESFQSARILRLLDIPTSSIRPPPSF